MGEPGWQNTAAICAEWLANVLPAEAAEVKR
jgi:hypothetical protein